MIDVGAAMRLTIVFWANLIFHSFAGKIWQPHQSNPWDDRDWRFRYTHRPTHRGDEIVRWILPWRFNPRRQRDSNGKSDNREQWQIFKGHGRAKVQWALSHHEIVHREAEQARRNVVESSRANGTSRERKRVVCKGNRFACIAENRECFSTTGNSGN